MKKQYQNWYLQYTSIFICKQYQNWYLSVPVLVPVTQSVAFLHGLRLVVWPKFGTNPARVAFGLVWTSYQKHGIMPGNLRTESQ